MEITLLSGYYREEYASFKDMEISLKQEFVTAQQYWADHWTDLLNLFSIAFEPKRDPGDSSYTSSPFVEARYEEGYYWIRMGDPACYKTYGPFNNVRQCFRNGARLRNTCDRLGEEKVLQIMRG